MDAPDIDPADEVGPDKATMDKAMAPGKSMEQDVLEKRLGGQTIRQASIEMKSDGGALVLDLLTTSMPARIEWDNGGKIVFMFKDRPYVIRK